MINSVIVGISMALYAEFGDNYEINMENIVQDLKEPCFLISCLEPTIKLYPGKRYFRQNQFCVQFFPEAGNDECHAVAEKMLWALEYIEADSETYHGTNMEYRIMDGVLNFFVNYDCFIYRHKPQEDVMDDAIMQIKMKGEHDGRE